MSGFEVIPAIDLRQGCVVRLSQGDYARTKTYADDPLPLAGEYADAGARWLHLVDLDGAREGGMRCLPIVRAIADQGLRVQTGGGVRSAADVRQLLDAGASRVVVGSIAMREPQTVVGWLARFGADQLTIALDARRRDGEWRLASAGWTEDAGVSLEDLAPRLRDAGMRHLLCTDIDRDGMLTGPNTNLYSYLREFLPSVSIQASGGIRGLADIQAVRKAGACAVILGRALLERRLGLAEALAC